MASHAQLRPFALVLAVAGAAGALTVWLTAPPSVLAGGDRYLAAVRHAVGDDASWAEPTSDDSSWSEIAFHETPASEGIFWLRGDLDLPADHAGLDPPLGLELAAMATCEVFWDGEALAHRGVVGATPIEETPGPLVQIVAVPERLATPGRHLVALRCSAHHRGFDPSVGFWYAALGNYGALAIDAASHTWPAALSLSAMVMVGLFYLLLFLLDRRDRSALALGLLALTGAALLVAESWRSLFPYTYDWHYTRLVVVTTLSWLLNLLLATFFVLRFPLGLSRAFLAATAVAATLPAFLASSWDAKSGLMFLGVGLLVLGRGAAAIARSRPGSALATAGVASLLAIAIANPFVFLDQTLFLALDLLMMCLLASHALRVRAARRERELALVKSARLEIELLKRHIQPHFLMNTLTALSEWIEEEPRVATRMIQSLAEEFRVLAEISSLRLIPVREELRLCRSHLEVLSHRQGRTYRLETEGVDGDAELPPAVLHTLVENAVTHNEYSAKEVTFRLRSRLAGDGRHYLLESPLGRRPRTATPRDGTGHRYVEARLQEAFGDRWRFERGPAGETWRCEIVVPASVPREAAGVTGDRRRIGTRS